jgi:hypothetical protein
LASADSRRGDLYGLAADGKALSAGFDASLLPQAGALCPRGISAGQDFRLVAAMKEIIARYVKDGVQPDLVEATKRTDGGRGIPENSVAGRRPNGRRRLRRNRRTTHEAIRRSPPRM